MGGDASRPKVLIVDDEYAIARTLALILNQSGFRALPIYHAWAALQVAEGLQPDILLTDVVMPGSDGFEVAEKICAKVPHCRVFLLSAQLQAADRMKEFRAQGYHFEFLHKPIHPTELLARLRVVVSETRRPARDESSHERLWQREE